jgi:hypothetical protein
MRNLAASVLAFALGSSVSAQEEPATPEIRALLRYLGEWEYVGEDHTPGSGGPVRCTAERRLISAGHFVESHRDCDTPRGRLSQVELFGYDYQRRAYTYWGFSGRVVSTYTTPDLGREVSWTGTAASQGNRCTEVFAADSQSSVSKCETTTDGGATWVLRSGGTSTRER